MTKVTWQTWTCPECETLAMYRIGSDRFSRPECHGRPMIPDAPIGIDGGARVFAGPTVAGLLDGREAPPNEQRPLAAVTLIAKGGVLSLTREEWQSVAVSALQEVLVRGPQNDVDATVMRIVRSAVLAPILSHRKLIGAALAELDAALATIQEKTA